MTAATGLAVSTAAPASAVTAWAEPGAITTQSFMMDIATVGAGGTSTWVCETCSDEYRQLLDVGHISGGTSDDVLGITASGQLRLHTSQTQLSGKVLAIGGGWQTYNQVAVVGDLTGDGRADLMARDTHGRLWFYASQVSLSQPFRPRVQVGSSWNVYDQLIGAANFDTAARGSLVTRDLQGRLWLYDGRSNGTLSARRQIGTGWNVYNQLIGLDRDQDGHGDILGRTEAGSLYLYKGTGTGGYAGRVKTPVDIPNWPSVNAIAGEGHQPDFGKGEVVGRMPNGDVYAYASRENGTFLPRREIAVDFLPAIYPLATTTVAFGDSGLPGFVYSARPLDTVGGVLLYAGASAQNVSLANCSAVAGPGDLDGDGHGDVVARDTGGHLWFIPGHADGTLGTGTRRLIGGGWNAYRTIVGASDLSGDGVADLVATTPGGDMYLYAGLANGAFASRVHVGSGWQSYTKIAAPGDLTGDGKGDLAAADSAGRLWLYPGLGNGHFGARVEIGTAGWNAFHDIS
ncbi:FG-GAP repeat domain-containing protein [Actinacidiphila acidipaludis]|uniref:VCBS repeat-containing protein n=1 Tax=Actinacidiphila acidipaludis TaxID=2873382 RepID=A0ABS7QHG0_9ACTN|nr:VCBS repeat-containing protein [Streptomyces acidipaludis]MBY8882608.1 VCBS repeat-containing protein [Streptomyces acidipaludis]